MIYILENLRLTKLTISLIYLLYKYMSSLSCYIFSCMCKWSGLEENHSGGGLFEHDCLTTELSLAFVQCSTCIGQDIGATHAPFGTRVMSCLCPIQCTKALVKTQTLMNYPITLGLIMHIPASTLGHKLFKGKWYVRKTQMQEYVIENGSFHRSYIRFFLFID
jgi:hypothetical protein